MNDIYDANNDGDNYYYNIMRIMMRMMKVMIINEW